MADVNVGYLNIELEGLQLAIKTDAPLEELPLKAEIEFVVKDDKVSFASTGTPTSSTAISKVFRQENEDSTVGIYNLGFSGSLHKTSYIDMTEENCELLANSFLLIKIKKGVEEGSVAASAGKGKKPAGGAPEGGAGDSYVDLKLPLSALLASDGTRLSFGDTIEACGAAGSILQVSQMNESVLAAESSLTWKVFADDDFSEFVMGSTLLSWQGASLLTPPIDWSLHYEDVIDPKAKVKPTDEELREKYLGGIAGLIEQQAGGKIASFAMTVGHVVEPVAVESEPSTASAATTGKGKGKGGKKAEPINEVVVEPEASPVPPPASDEPEIKSLLPTLTLSAGTITYDAETASNVSIEEDIRARQDLWSVQFGHSRNIFIHRRLKRSIASTLQKNFGIAPEDKDEQCMMPVKLKKAPEATDAPAGGKGKKDAPAVSNEPAVTINAVLDITPLSDPGKCEISLEIDLPAPAVESMEAVESAVEGETPAAQPLPSKIIITASLSSPIVLEVPKALKENVEDSGDGSAELKPIDVIKARLSAEKFSKETIRMRETQMSKPRDVLKELKDELADIIGKVSKEYLTLYPTATAVSAEMQTSSSNGLPPMENDMGGSSAASAAKAVPTMAERQAEFMYHLSTSGVYHNFKEKLKPRIQRLVRERYGVRGQAVNVRRDAGGYLSEAAAIDSVLTELYIFLSKECNSVLNSIFTNTLIDRDAAEVEKGAVDDETETVGQRFMRLLRESVDAEADDRVDAADQLHLERLQMVGEECLLGSENASVHDAYAGLGEFYLRQAALYNSMPYYALPEAATARVALNADAVHYFHRSRQALQVAYAAETNWRVGLLLACTYAELDQYEQADPLFVAVLESQLKGRGSEKGGLTNLDEFDGYETDKLVPVHPLFYSVLAAHYAILKQPLKVRKALKLADASFVELGCQPAVYTHGTPRRTVVVCLSQACEFLFANGFVNLGHSCVELLLSCDKAITQKTEARNLPASSLPFVRHLIKRSLATASMMAPPAAYVNALLSDQMQSVTTDMIRRKRLVEAVELADESRIAADCATDISQGWLTLAKAHTLLLEDMAAVCDGYHRWVNAMKGSLDGKITISDGSGLLLESSRSQGLNTKLCLLRYGKVLLHLGRYQDVLDLLLPLCKTEPSSAILLLVGQCCLRMDRLEDAEDALQEANLLDNRNPEVWAYLSILCLSGSGSLRHAEADAAMAQAVRLGLASPALLRELAGSFMSIDQLLTAEDLIRRAISAETEGLPETDGAGANPRTRKMLGDILAGQNQAAKAVEEYMLILSDEMADADTKVAVASNCLPLLQALGRKNEIVYLNEVMRSMRA